MSRISSLTLAAGMALSAVAAPAMTTDEAKKAAFAKAFAENVGPKG